MDARAIANLTAGHKSGYALEQAYYKDADISALLSEISQCVYDLAQSNSVGAAAGHDVDTDLF